MSFTTINNIVECLAKFNKEIIWRVTKKIFFDDDVIYSLILSFLPTLRKGRDAIEGQEWREKLGLL